MPFGTRVRIRVIDKNGNDVKVILRCLRYHIGDIGEYSVLYEGKRYKVEYLYKQVDGQTYRERCIYLR